MPGPRLTTLALLLTGVALHGCGGDNDETVVTSAPPLQVAAQPNILFIMADDFGYSDIGAYGGEINTPNLDALAASGRLLTKHHTETVCAVTRSALISGTDHHLVGEGTMGRRATNARACQATRISSTTDPCPSRNF